MDCGRERDGKLEDIEWDVAGILFEGIAFRIFVDLG